MFFVPPDLPELLPCDLTKSFDPVNCPTNIAQKAHQISAQRHAFLEMFKKISSNPDTCTSDIADGDAILGYLNTCTDLLQLSANANFPLALTYVSGAHKGTPHSIPGQDNEVAATTEICFTRILASLGMLSSLRGNFTKFRAAVQGKDILEIQANLKVLKPNVEWAAVRLLKMTTYENLIYPGIKNQPGPLEITPNYARALQKLAELNLASILVGGLIYAKDQFSQTAHDVTRQEWWADYTYWDSDFDAKKTRFSRLYNIASSALETIDQVRGEFKKWDGYALATDVLHWCDIAEAYYITIASILISVFNKRSRDELCPKVKSRIQFIVEDFKLADNALQSRHWLQTNMNTFPDTFNFKQNAQHALGLTLQFKDDFWKQNIQTYEVAKSSYEKEPNWGSLHSETVRDIIAKNKPESDINTEKMIQAAFDKQLEN